MWQSLNLLGCNSSFLQSLLNLCSPLIVVIWLLRCSLSMWSSWRMRMHPRHVAVCILLTMWSLRNSVVSWSCSWRVIGSLQVAHLMEHLFCLPRKRMASWECALTIGCSISKRWGTLSLYHVLMSFCRGWMVQRCFQSLIYVMGITRSRLQRLTDTSQPSPVDMARLSGMLCLLGWWQPPVHSSVSWIKCFSSC
mgnify:CR=1 FL=1